MLNMVQDVQLTDEKRVSEHTDAGIKILSSDRKTIFLQTSKPPFVVAVWQWVGAEFWGTQEKRKDPSVHRVR